MIFIDSSKPEDPLSIDKLDQRDNEERGDLVEQLILIPSTGESSKIEC